MASAVTGYKISGGIDLNNVFASYESGPQAAVTGYKISGGADLNTVFAPYVSGPQALATGYNSSFGDLNQAFARLKQWEKVGGGATGGFNSGSCRTLAFDSSGNLYAGGAFTTANGENNTSCNNIAKLAVGATAWTPVGSGINGTVYIIAIDISNNIYAGGGFTGANGGNNTPCNNIAKFPVGGTAWEKVGSGTGGGVNNFVYGLKFNTNGDLYAGGSFNSANVVTCNAIAKLPFNTSAWEKVGSGTGGGFDNVVGYIAIDSLNNVYAGGYFSNAYNASTTACNRIAKLVGTAWTPVGSGTGGGFNDFVYGLACDSSNNVYAGGGFTGANGGTTSCNRIAKFSSTVGTTAWAQVGSGAGGGFNGIVYGVACDVSNNVYALGGFTGANKSGPSTIPCNRIAKFPVGTTDWAQVGGGVGSGVGGGFNQANGLHAAVDSSGNIYACGSFTTANTTSGAFTCNRIAKCA
jgi:hypothetical protein